MAAPRRRRGRTESALSDGGELNLTPLLDVIFNLIFFFILATTIKTDDRFYQLTLPESSQAPREELTEVIPEISIDADGRMALDGQLLTPDEMLVKLRETVERTGATRAILSADGNATVNQTTAAADILHEAGIREMMQRVKKK